METNHTFRTAFSGFNREDVVHYIEYLNSKHTNALNQLKSENKSLSDEAASLREKLDKAAAEDPRVAELTARCEALEAEKASLTHDLEDVQEQLLQAETKLQDESNNIAEEELAAYRRAEQAERSANERAQQICQQATGTLADATAQVDGAAEQFQVLSDKLNTQMSELQAVVSSSKAALTGAAEKLYALRPEGSCEE